MAAISHGESKTWWGNKFSPKNSKWLQSNISETEKKVRAMVKILEEDADSFARRADMYYKRRPELMLLAKEFYGAYRALAERYDVAAGALRVATRSLADAFPNQTPPSLSLPDEPPSTPLSEPQTPDMPPPARSLFDTDQLHNDKIGNSPNVHKKNSEGLKQVNDLFQGEPKARKGLSFQADKAQKTKHEDGVGLEMASLQRDIFHLSEETKRLKDQVLAEAERANKAEGELLTLKGNILHLSFEKDAACIECQSHSERLMNVESELSQAHSDLLRLREVEKLSQEQKLEVELLEKKVELQVMELEQLTEKLQEVEKSKLDSVRNVEKLTEQNLSSEMTIRKLQGKIGVLEGTTEKLKREIQGLQEKLHELVSNLSLSEEENKFLKEKLQETEATVSDLQIEIELLRNERENLEAEVKTLRGSIFKLKYEKEGVQRDFNQLKLEMAIEADMLRNAEKLNLAQQSELELLQVRLKSQEEDYHELVREIGELNEQKITSEETLRELLRDLSSLKETKEKLEKEVVVHLREKETLQRDLSLQIQDTCDLSNKLQILTAQTEAAIKVNAVLKEAFTKYEIERGILSEKNAVLEKELSDTIVELKLLRERVSELEISEESLSNQISVHVSEKADLASYFSEIYEKNSALESSLFDVSEKLKASEASCQSLISQKSGLVAERDDLFCQVESMTAVIKSLEDKHRGLEEKQSALSKERDFKHNELNKLQELLSSKIVEHELHVTSFEDQIEYLSEMNSGQLSEIEHLSKKLKDSEAAHQLLINEKQDLLAVKDDLFSQVENITVAMKNLEEKHLSLSDERDLLQNNLKELELLLTCKTEECENAVRSHEMHATTLGDQILVHVSEKEALATQIETLNHTINDVRNRNNELESSLSAANAQIEALNDQKSTLDAEIEGLKEKLKESEDCCWSVIEQKSVLIAERDELSSQVASIKLDMKNLEDAHSILEENHSSLSKERDRMQNHSQELELLLKAKIEELDSAVKSHEMHAFDLKSQISEHISEKTDLVSGIQALNHKIEAISTKNCELESSLSVVNAEMEDMKKKLKEGEESCQSLIDQKSVLISEKNSLLLQVDSLTELLKNFEDKHAVLEQKHLSLSKDRDTMECQLKEFQELLNCKAEEHRGALQSHELHVATLQDQIFTHTSQIETLQNTIKEISRKNSSLNSSLCDLNSEIDGLNVALNESQQMCQSLLAERSALRCQKDDLSAQVHTMKRLCKQLETKQEDLEENLSVTSDERDLAVNRLNNLHNALFIKQEEHAMALKSHELHVANLQDQLLAHVFEKASLSFQVESLTHVIQQQEEKHSILSEEGLAMHNQLQELRALLDFKTQEHENQIHELQERNQLTEENLEKEQVKNSSVSNHLFILERSLSDMVDQHLQVSQLTEQVISRLEEEERENMVLREQNKRLREGICEFTNALGIKNEDDMIEEVILPAISCKIKNVIKLKEEGEDLNICMDLELSVLTTILCQMGLDLTGLKLVKGVLKRELEIKETELRDLHRNLMHEVQTGKQREEAFKRKIKDLSSNLALSKNEISTLREKNETIGKELQLSVSECLMLQHLCSFFDSLSTERGSLLKTFSDEITSLNLEIINMNNKLGALDGENKSLKMSLSCLEDEFRANLIISEFNLIHTKDLYQELSLEKSGLEKEITILSKEKEKMQTEVYGLLSEFEKCQRHISSLVSEVIALAVGTAVCKEEVLELMTENEGLEIRALAQKEALMDGISLKDTFIEGLNTKLLEMEGENKKLKAGLDAYLPLVESLRDCVSSLELHTLSLSRRLQASQLKQDKALLSDRTSTELPSGVFELQNLITKIESLDESLIGTTNQLKPKLLTSIKESNGIPHEGVRRQINLPESSTTKTREVGMKDIELDQVSSSSLYGASRGEITEVDDHMLKLWATDDGKPRKSSSVNEYDIQAVEEIRNGPYSSELTAEKELGVDRQIPGDMRKVLEKLSADEQRLSALKTGMEELKQKLEGSPKGKFPSSTEYDALKVQLSEAEEALTKQIEINKKATKNAEYYSEALDAVAEEQSEQRHVSRRKIAEVTQKASEKIGRLELELQKIQYVLLKVQEAHERRGKSAEKRARVLLRDYIYGRRKRLPLCGCIRAKNAQGGRD
ncbi:hypothetical protein LUZ63_018736 [Rhynchospora breviuscula]|uniref:NAB domain-containing protein n=1 Tax=Rhynchospora breviuscula TaxID=2022672 RepID=A0A9Q0C4V5_9POAL|nr:hypothetical protein LUZ63_018736 [Rhynchospora breviuscula]